MGYHHLLLKGNYMYEPLIRVPLIVKYPSQQQAGSICKALVNSTDCAPTLLQSAGCAVPQHMAGSDLLDLPLKSFHFKKYALTAFIKLIKILLELQFLFDVPSSADNLISPKKNVEKKDVAICI